MRGSTRGTTGQNEGGAGGDAGVRPALTADERREILLRYANDSVLLFDSDYRVIDCNDRATEVFGYPRDELIGLGIDVVRAEQPDVPLAQRRAALLQADRSVFESVGRRKDGSTFPIETSLHVVGTERGRLYHATIRDMSERKAAEAEIRRSHALLEEAEGAADIGHWTWDRGTDVLMPSAALLRLVGVDPSSPTPAEDLRAHIHPDDVAGRDAALEHIRRGETVTFAYRVIRPGGEVRYIEGVGGPLFDEHGELSGESGVAIDVTERRRAEQALREREESYGAIFEGSPFAMALMTDDSRVVDANAAFFELMGGSRLDIVGRTVVELGLAPAGDVQGLAGRLRRDGAVRDVQLSRTSLSGRPFVIALDLTPVRIGGRDYVLSIYRDITEWKRAEEAAQEGRAKLEVALQSMTDAVYIFDAEGRLIDFNDAFVTFHRFASREECVRSLRDYPGISEVFRPDGREASFEEWPSTRALRGEIGTDEEYVVRRTDTGEITEGSFSFSPLRDETGGITGAVIVARDITERKRADRELSQSRAKLDTALASMTDAVFISDLEGNFVDFNAAFATFHKFASKEECARTLREYPEFLEVFMEDGSLASFDMWAVPRALRGETVEEAVYGLRRKDTGEEWTGSFSFAPIRDEAGEITGSVVVGRDITDRIRTDHELKESEERFRSLFENSPLALLLTSPEGSVHDANPAACSVFGRDKQELVALGRDGLLDATDPRLSSVLDEGVRTGHVQAGELTGVRGHGDRFPAEVDMVVLPTEPPRSLVMVRDITARKEMEAALRRSETAARETVERLSRAQLLGHIGDWEWDVATGAVHWSDEVYRMYGVGPDFPTTFETITRMTHPDDNESNLKAAQAILDDPERSSGALQFRVVRPDGGIRHVFQTLAVDRDEEGGPTRVFGLMQDVTELRQAEEARMHSERSLQRIFDAGLVGVVYWTADGGLTDTNDRFLEMVGYTREDLEAGRIGWADITPPEWEARDRASLEELRTTGRNAVPFEKEYYRKDGTRLPILTTAATLDDAGTHGIAIVLDISDQKRAEDELRRFNVELEERVRRRTMDLEAANAELEAFAYSVSHDLRAPLRHISGFAQLLGEELDDAGEGSEGRHFIDRITHAAADMSTLIDDLLRFSRVGRTEMHIEQVDMAALLDEELEVLRVDLGERRVEVAVGQILPAAGDRTLLRQVWANIVGNAFKYTRDRDPARIEVGSQMEDGRVVYRVSDNGVGFDMQYADRAFRVFERLHRSDEFEGNGIGLANVSRILGRHDGSCWAESVEGEGSTFYFSLPGG